MINIIKKNLKILDKKFFGEKLYRFSNERKLEKSSQQFQYSTTINYHKPTNAALAFGKLCEEHGSDKGYVSLRRDTPFASKPHTYSHLYTQLFKDKADNIKKVFECGIGTNNPNIESNMTATGKPGASLRVWKDFFKNAEIFGADIDKKILFTEDRIKTFYVNQLDPNSIEKLWKSINENNFDIIVDDGLHTYDAALTLFQKSFEFLKTGGYYIIEDIPTSFLEKLAYKLKDYNPHVVSFIDSIKIAYENNLIYVRKN
jgi:hypothetical protein